MKKLLFLIFAIIISGLSNAQDTDTKKQAKKDAAKQVALKKEEIKKALQIFNSREFYFIFFRDVFR